MESTRWVTFARSGAWRTERAEIQDAKVRLHLRSSDGSEREILTEHVIAATGYKVDVERLAFLDAEIRSKIETVESTLMLSSNFESSVPGLYLVGSEQLWTGDALRVRWGLRSPACGVCYPQITVARAGCGSGSQRVRGDGMKELLLPVMSLAEAD